MFWMRTDKIADADPSPSTAAVRFEVWKTVADGSAWNWVLYESPAYISTGAHVLDIKRNGDNYEFYADNTLLYTTGTNANDTYGLASKNSMIYYQIVAGGSQTMTAVIDDFGIPSSGNSGYSDWALGPFLGTLSDTDPALDFDGGGLASAIEWVTGGDPTDSADDASVTPICDNTTDPDFFIFTYRRSDLANTDENTTIVVEYGSDLNGWTPAVDDATNVIITPTDEGGGAGIDLVQVKLKRSTLAIDNKLFARLKVIVAGL
jgi:hypothetical protein